MDDKKAQLNNLLRKAEGELNPSKAIHGELMEHTDILGENNTQLKDIQKSLKESQEINQLLLEEIKKTNEPKLEETNKVSLELPEGTKVLNLKGGKGDKGDTGEQGIAGKDGAKGEQGLAGKDGEPGLPGRDGKNGKDGRNGKDGAKGDKGDKGDSGEDAKPEDIVNLLRKERSLDISDLRNSEQIISLIGKVKNLESDGFNFNGKKYKFSELMHGGGSEGGGTPASPDTSVQYNNGGSFGGSLLFYDNSSEPSTATFTTPNGTTDGTNLSFITGGAGLNGNGGRLQLAAGFGGSISGNGGIVEIGGGQAQSGSNGDGGSVGIYPGDKDGSGSPGQFLIVDSSLATANNGYVWTLVDDATGAGEWMSSTGGGVDFGTDGQIPYMNPTDDNFDYSSDFTFVSGGLIDLRHAAFGAQSGINGGSILPTLSFGAVNTIIDTEETFTGDQSTVYAVGHTIVTSIDSSVNSPGGMGLVVYPTTPVTNTSDYDLMFGVFGSARHQGEGTIATAAGMWYSVENRGIGIIDTGIGVRITDGANTGGGTINNLFGLYIDQQTVGVNNYNIYSAGGRNLFSGHSAFGADAVLSDVHIVDIKEEFDAGTGDFSQYNGINSQLTVHSTDDGAPTSIGANLNVLVDGNDAGQVIGVQGLAAYFGSGSVNNVKGLVYSTFTSGTVGNSVGAEISVNQFDGTITTAKVLNITADIFACDDAYGIYIDNISGASTTNRAIQTGSMGDVAFGYLGGGGTQMVTADNDGILGVQAIPNYATGETYTITNVTPDRSYDADATNINELADVLGALIDDLRSVGILI